MRIGILTNFNNGCTDEDFIIAKSFAEDGHKVDLLDFPINFDFEKVYDLVILKNTWDLNEKTYKNYLQQLDKVISKLKQSKCKFVSSLDGKLNFEKYGKKYLVELYKSGYNVVPTISDIADIDKLPKVAKYIKKPFVAYDGFDMQVIDQDKLRDIKLDNEILQPKLDFISEVQLYFVNDKFQYALEYSPSKWPDYPTPHLFKPNKKYINQAAKVIELNGASCSFNRVDFLRLNKEDMVILEFADSSPNLSLPMLDNKTLKVFLQNFKDEIYNYVAQEKDCQNINL